MKIGDSHTLRSSKSVKIDGFQEVSVRDVHVGQVSNDRNHMKQHMGRFQVSIGVLENLEEDIEIDRRVGLDGADKIKVKDLYSDHVPSPVPSPVIGSGVPKGPREFQGEDKGKDSSSEKSDPNTIIPGTGRNKMFVTLLIAPEILFCSSGTSSYLTVKNILERRGDQNDLHSFKEHYKNIISSHVTGANTTSTFTSTTSSSPSSTPVFHSLNNDTEDSIFPAVCLVQIRDMVSFRSSNDPPGFSRMQSEEMLFSNIASQSDYLPGESFSINRPVHLNSFGATKQKQKQKQKQERKREEHMRNSAGIASVESSESQVIPSMVFRSKVPASASSYLGGGIEVILTLRPGTLSALHGRVRNTTSSSSSSSRSRSDRNIVSNKKGASNVYGEKWVSIISKKKFVISLRCGGLPGLQEQSTSPSASPSASPPPALISTSSSFLFTMIRSLSSVFSSPFAYITPFFIHSTATSAPSLVPGLVPTILSSTQPLHSLDTARTRQYSHRSRVTKKDDVIISSSINVPIDDITLDTANAAFSYVIGGKEMKSDEQNSFLYDSNLSSESLQYAYKIRSGKRVAERNNYDDSDSELDVSASFKWIIRKPRINGFHSDNYLYIRMTPITNISTDTSKVPDSVAHKNSFKARMKSENENDVGKGNGFENYASASYDSEVRAKHEHEDPEERRNVFHRSSWSGKQKQLKKNEVKEVTDDVADAVDEAFMLNFDYLAVLAVTFTPCPKGSCKHGYCAIQLGDVQSSTCICR